MPCIYQNSSHFLPSAPGFPAIDRLNPTDCPYCGQPTTLKDMFRFSAKLLAQPGLCEIEKELWLCTACGWWATSHRESDFFDGTSPDTVCDWRATGQRAVLKRLDASDVQVGIAELQSYLLARYESRFDVEPHRFESMVAGVFSALGFEPRVTSRSKDGGIDIIVLDGPSDQCIGVQVKRYRRKIKAEQIREFVGALVLGGLEKGIFVTTSTFQPGAVGAAARASELGLPIELWDACRFYERLGVRSQEFLPKIDCPEAPWYQAWTECISSFDAYLSEGRVARTDPDDVHRYRQTSGTHCRTIERVT